MCTLYSRLFASSIIHNIFIQGDLRVRGLGGDRVIRISLYLLSAYPVNYHTWKSRWLSTAAVDLGHLHMILTIIFIQI